MQTNLDCATAVSPWSPPLVVIHLVVPLALKIASMDVCEVIFAMEWWRDNKLVVNHEP